MTDEMHYRLMRLLESSPEMSQREVARELGISVGKVNYCVRALIARGLVKAKRFRNSRNKLAYIYLLTPRGLQTKTEMTVRFLRSRMKEYEDLRQEIERMRAEIGTARRPNEGARS